jgi:isoquinoline 1-oxidoreductase
MDGARPETSITYAELTQGKKIERNLEEKAEVKPVSELEIIGKPILRRDSLEKVTGKAKYAGDIRLPGIVYAAIVRPPAHGAKVQRVDTTAAEALEGVDVVRDGDLVAVLHEHPDGAKKALDAVQAEFDVPEPAVDDRTIFDHLLKVAPEPRTVEEGGDLVAGEKGSTEVFEETYYDGYVSHAPIEPHTALANIEGDKATVWASTQAPFRVKEEVAEALGFPPERVHVVTPFVGGGFGGKVQGRQAVEAARLAKACGKPVQVAWSRAEEFFYDSFRPAAVVKIKSGADAKGRLHFWDYKVYFAGRRGSEHIYEIPNHSTLAYGEWGGAPPGAHPFAVGAWRAPACNTNAFARESQIDVMASKLGRDPVEFRLENLKDERMRRVIKAARDKFGWVPASSPSGRGFGVACGIDADTYVAFIAEATVDRDSGAVQVKRVVCAQDMGLVVNPQGAKIQMEGCITMGLGYALSEEIHFKGGEITEDNFDTYEIPRFSWLPSIETVILDIKDEPPHGGGEPAIIGMGAVIANAIFDGTGARLTMMPMTPERIKQALSKASSG